MPILIFIYAFPVFFFSLLFGITVVNVNFLRIFFFFELINKNNHRHWHRLWWWTIANSFRSFGMRLFWCDLIFHHFRLFIHKHILRYATNGTLLNVRTAHSKLSHFIFCSLEDWSMLIISLSWRNAWNFSSTTIIAANTQRLRKTNGTI